MSDPAGLLAHAVAQEKGGQFVVENYGDSALAKRFGVTRFHQKAGWLGATCKPADNTKFKPNDDFDIKWTIVNNGTRTLRAGLDLKFSNGDKLMPDKVVELPELKPGAEFTVNCDATAPSKAGTYIMAYLVEGGLCYP